ncbi:hypothetical protein B0H66DRAFT_629720 [Apodospora peruviana]|uniref:Mitochondrial distribution and morphology protein 10 n=1 Tax=Apodospora peruviana TaxID=516989 RepID=A0AAE0HVP1_9PEZI|nr:hypothetical protein B0H66DRAFT_629720 [Apodospora peruviana]
MREFMHYITNAFYGATGWNDDNTYKELTATARELIDFPLPRGLRLTLSSLATPHFATSYQLGSVDVVDGSISYLYTSVSLTSVAAQSDKIPLPALLRSYRRLHDLGSRGQPWLLRTDAPIEPAGPPVLRKIGLGPQSLSQSTAEPPTAADATRNTSYTRRFLDRSKGSLLYGRLYLPQSLLEGLVIKRFSPALQVQVSAVSGQSLRNGGTLLGLIQYDNGKYGVEGLGSTDGGLLGVRGIYNFGGDASSDVTPPASEGNGGGERIYGRFSAGGELYYGTLNKSGGMSLGARFATLPAHRGTPLTATLTINPLMGSINATYAVLAKDYCSLATRMEFNVYSYESEWAVGMELWSNRRPAGFLLGVDPSRDPEPVAEPPKKKERSFQAKMEWRLDDPEPEVTPEPRPKIVGSGAGDSSEDRSGDITAAKAGATEKKEYKGVLKARLDQKLRIGLLWEGRAKSLIFSIGTGIDLYKLGEPFRSLGLEVQYSS